MNTAIFPAGDQAVLSAAVVDTNVFTAILRTRSPLAAAYLKHLRGRVLAVTYETVAEARYGALRGGWGRARVDRLEALLGSTPVLPLDDEGATAVAQLRHECARIGHPCTRPSTPRTGGSPPPPPGGRCHSSAMTESSSAARG